MPLIEGCINPLIKRRLVEAIDEGCSQGGELDSICTHFRDELYRLPDCHERVQHFMPQSAPPPAPSYEKEKVKVLTDYQKHMSMCLRDKDASFNICLTKWKDPGTQMHHKYVPKEGER